MKFIGQDKSKDIYQGRNGEFLSLDKDVFRNNKENIPADYLEIFNRITKD